MGCSFICYYYDVTPKFQTNQIAQCLFCVARPSFSKRNQRSKRRILPQTPLVPPPARILGGQNTKEKCSFLFRRNWSRANQKLQTKLFFGGASVSERRRGDSFSDFGNRCELGKIKTQNQKPRVRGAFDFVPGRGLEPPRDCSHSHLKAARVPVAPPGRTLKLQSFSPTVANIFTIFNLFRVSDKT